MVQIASCAAHRGRHLDLLQLTTAATGLFSGRPLGGRFRNSQYVNPRGPRFVVSRAGGSRY